MTTRATTSCRCLLLYLLKLNYLNLLNITNKLYYLNLLNFHYNMNYLNLVFLPTAWTSPTWSRLILLHQLDPLRHMQSSNWTLPLLRFMSRLSLRAFVA